MWRKLSMASLSVGQVSALIAAGTAIGTIRRTFFKAQGGLIMVTSPVIATTGDSIDSYRIHQQKE